MKYDVFISYRRDGGEYTAKIVRDRLEALGYRVFFDVESLRSGNFNTRLYSVIDECRDVLLILSPGSLDRCVNPEDWVRREIEYALDKGKNIVPILLRGFAFPQRLPSTLGELRYKNGLEASSQFFDAFIQKLTTFLTAKAPLAQRITRDPLLRRTLPFLLALVLFAGAALGIGVLVRSRGGVYPRTQAERNLVGELLYHLQNNLTRQDLMLGEAQRAYAQCERFLSSPSPLTQSDAVSALAQAYADIKRTDLSGCLLPESLSAKLDNSPFVKADAAALGDYSRQMQEELLDTLLYLYLVFDPQGGVAPEMMRDILTIHQKLLDSTASVSAYAANELLLPVTQPDALEEFKGDYIPTLLRLPLGSQVWLTDKAELERLTQAGLNQQQDLALQLATLVGDGNLSLLSQEAGFTNSLLEMGLTQQEAESYLARLRLQVAELTDTKRQLAQTLGDVDAKQQELREKFAPQPEDEPGMLWGKMLRFLTVGMPEDAINCVRAYQEKVSQADENAAVYAASAIRFIQQMEQTGVSYGLLVGGYEPGKPPHISYQVGDILIANGDSPCRNLDDYEALMPEGDFEATLLRPDEAGQLERITVQVPAGQPRILFLEMTETD